MNANPQPSRLVNYRFETALKMMSDGVPPQVVRRRLKIKKRTFNDRLARARRDYLSGVAS